MNGLTATKQKLATALLVAVCLFTLLPPSNADDLEDCREGTERELAQVSIASCTRVIDSNAQPAQTLAEAHINRARAYQSELDSENALADYTKAIELGIQSADVFEWRGAVYNNLGRTDEALADLTKAISLAPDRSSAYRRRGTAYADSGNYEQALPDYAKAIELDPQNAEALIGRGWAYNFLAEPEKAIADFNHAVSLGSEDPGAHDGLGYAYNALREFDKALAELQRALDLGSDDPNVYNRRGFAFTKLGRLSEAINEYSRAIEIGPGYANGYYNRSLQYEKLKRFEDALADIRRAIEIAGGAGANEDYDNLESRLTKFLRLSDPKLEIAALSGEDAGEVCLLSEDLQRTVDACTQAIDKNAIPYPPELYRLVRLETYSKLGKLDLALSDANLLVAANPFSGKALLLRGDVLFRQAKITDALQDFDAAIGLEPEDYRAHYHRGRVMASRGKPEAAIEDYDTAIKNLNGFIDAEVYLARTASLIDLGRAEAAERDLNRAESDAGAEKLKVDIDTQRARLAKLKNAP